MKMVFYKDLPNFYGLIFAISRVLKKKLNIVNMEDIGNDAVYNLQDLL